MAVKVSKRTREQAALICAVAASGPFTTSFAAEQVGGTSAAMHLAAQALTAALDSFPAHDSGERPPEFSHVVRAEAEALLRTGWTP